jgi:hypothetical protein
MPADRLVTDLAIWTGCPFPVARGLEVRRGKVGDEAEIVALWHPETQRHVDFNAGSVSEETFLVAGKMLTERGV